MFRNIKRDKGVKMKYISTREMPYEVWFKERRNSIGMSDVSAVLGHNPYKSNVDLYFEKVNDVEPIDDNLHMRLGRDLEPIIKKLFEEETGLKVFNDNKIRFDRRYAFLTANLDGFVTKERVPVEYKTMTFWDGDIPDYYYCQIQGQMMVTETPYIYFCGLVLGHTKEFFVEKYYRDEEFIKNMRKELVDFWGNNVCKKIPPIPRSTRDARKVFNQVDPEKILEAENPELDNINALNELNKKKKKILKDIESNQLDLMKKMEDKELMSCNGLDLVTWKKTKPRKKFDMKQFKKDHPELHEEYMKEVEGQRRFLIKIKEQ